MSTHNLSFNRVKGHPLGDSLKVGKGLDWTSPFICCSPRHGALSDGLCCCKAMGHLYHF